MVLCMHYTNSRVYFACTRTTQMHIVHALHLHARILQCYRLRQSNRVFCSDFFFIAGTLWSDKVTNRCCHRCNHYIYSRLAKCSSHSAKFKASAWIEWILNWMNFIIMNMSKPMRRRCFIHTDYNLLMNIEREREKLAPCPYNFSR